MPHQPAQRRFRGVVGRQAGARDQPRDRGDEDDRAPCVHARQGVPAAEHRPAQVDAQHRVPLVRLHGGEAQPADPDADVQHHAVQPAHRLHGLVDHPGNVGLAGDVGLDHEGVAALLADQPDRGLAGLSAAVGDGDLRAFAGEQERHGAAVADRVGVRVHHLLPAADDQDPAARQPAPAGRAAFGLGAGRADIALVFGHGVSPRVCGKTRGGRRSRLDRAAAGPCGRR